MKAALFLLCALGTSTSNFLVRTGEENVYNYQGKILTGIPELEQTFAGMAIECEVLLQGQGFTAEGPGNGVFKIALRNIKFNNFNEKLSGPEPLNWRTLVTPATSPVPEALKVFLESPVQGEMEAWKIKKVTLSADEPEWSVNFKKALVAAIKVQLPATMELPNQIPRSHPMTHRHLPAFWTVMEQGIDGVCENTYQVTEVPAYLVSEAEKALMKPEMCEGKKIFQVMRTRDITKCTERSLFVATRGHENCLVGGCNGVNGKVGMTRFLGCGTDTSDFQMHAIINEGEHQQNLLSFNTEKVMTGTRQVLALKEVRKTQTALPNIAAPRDVEDLLFEYPKAVTSEERRQISSFKKQQDHFRQKAMDPANDVFRPDGEIASMTELKTKIVEKLTLVAEALNDVQNFGSKQTTAILKSLTNVIAMHTVEEIKAIFVEVENKPIERRLLLDTVKMAGTSPAVMFFKEMIMANKLNIVEMVEVLMTLPHNIKAPNVHIIEQIFELIQHPNIVAHKMLKHNAHIAFATILNRACFNTQESVFPVNVFGEMCTPENPKIANEYIPHLKAELSAANDEEVHAAILALGTIGHDAVLPILLPYIEGKVTRNVSHRKMAIYALANVARKYRQTLLPIYSAIVFNQGENRQLRMAALSVMLPMDPSPVHLQKLAVATWLEQDEVVAKFIYTSLKSLAHIKREEVPSHSRMLNLVEKASAVLPLAKPYPGIISSTFNYFVADMLTNLGIGYQAHTASINTEQSHVFYHKLERFFVNAADVPLEFAVQVGGLRNVILEALRSLSVSSPVNADLVKIIRQLEITPQTEEALETLIWGRSNDIQFAIASPMLNAEYIVAKLQEIIKTNPMSLVEKAKAKVCGQTPFNVNYAFEYLPYKAIVPSEMGFPIFIESQATGLIHARGDLALKCSSPVPELEATIIKKAAYSYSGYVGHICPFTHQLMAAGVDTHRSTNVPVQASIKLEITTGTVKVEAKQLASVTPQMTAVDIMHFHVKPFTTLKPNLLVDLIPIALSPATKVIKSQSPRKAFEMALGERLGLDLKIKAVTECEVSDKKTVLDSLRNYRYNPILAVIFQGSETALKMNGQPSVRFHRYTVVHNPAASTTKAIEMEIKLAAATKIRNTPLIKHIASRSPMKAMHEEMLDNSIAKLIGSEHILATNALVTVKLMGGAPKTLKLSKTLALGLKDMELKWNVHLEEIRASPRMICMTGLVELPTEVQAIRKFNFQNKIGFGASCEEHAITMNGFTVTSQKQIEYSKRSEAARDCPRISREATELDMQLRTLPEGAEKAKMVQTYGQLVLKREYICGMQRRQETALDQVQIEITATPNLPVQVLTVGRYLDSILKGLLVEYVNQLPNIHNRDMHGVKMIIEFDQRLQALNLKITSPLDTTVFKNIRLPAWIRQILPLHHSTNLVEQVYRAVLGERLYGKCILERGHVHTFDKKTYNYQLDDCYHMVAADCSKRNSHAVLAKEKDNAKHVMIFSENNKIVIEEPATRYTRPTTPFTVKTQTGEERMVSVEVVPDQVAHLLEGRVSVSWARGVLTVDTPAHRVIYNGKTLDVMNKAVFAAGDQCGLCGDHNRMRLSDIKSSSQCVHTSLLSMAHSYRVNSAIEQCSPLSSSAVERLSNEKAMCASSPSSPLQVSYSSPVTQAKVLRHAVLHRTGQVCFSKEMLPECDIGFIASETMVQEAGFVCLPAAAAEAKDILRRIHLGQDCNELNSMTVTFTTRVRVAKQCTQQ